MNWIAQRLVVTASPRLAHGASYGRYGWTILAAVLAVVAWMWPAGTRSAHPLALDFWYWHHPFRMADRERETLRSLQVRRLYVHAGNLIVENGDLATDSPQEWQSPLPCEVWAVLRVNPRANSRLIRAGDLPRLVSLLRGLPVPKGIAGVQLDADVPTAQIKAYALQLTRLRAALPHGWRLSITALPDWLGSPFWERLAASVDEIVPQFYGNLWPEPNQPIPPIWELNRLDRALGPLCATRPGSVSIGLPIYGRCVVTDEAGRPAAVRHDVDPESLADDPAWELTDARTRRGPLPGRPTETRSGKSEEIPSEDQVAFRAREEASAGPLELPAGGALWFQWPRLTAVAQTIQALRQGSAARSTAIQSICLFRWPAPGEPLGVPNAALPVLQSPVPGKSTASTPTHPNTHTPTHPTPELRLLLTRHGKRLTVGVACPGPEAPLLGDDVRLEVFPAGAEVIAAEAPEWRLGDDPASPLRADHALFRRSFLRPGTTWQACEVLAPTATVRARLSWHGQDGTLRTVGGS